MHERSEFGQERDSRVHEGSAGKVGWEGVRSRREWEILHQGEINAISFSCHCEILLGYLEKKHKEKRIQLCSCYIIFGGLFRSKQALKGEQGYAGTSVKPSFNGLLQIRDAVINY